MSTMPQRRLKASLGMWPFERGDLGKDQYMVFQREVEETCGEHPGGVLSVSKVTENPDGI